jgi:hypothetical protein
VFDLDFLHRAARMSHVAVGLIGVALFWFPVFARKGGPLHIRTGRLFVYCAYYVGVTGLIGSIWALVHPVSFYGDVRMQRVTPAELPFEIESTRFLFSITGFLALLILAGTVFGVRVMRTREDHARLRSPLLLALEIALGVWSLALAAYGFGSLAAFQFGWHWLPAEAAGRYWINAILGVVGVSGAVGDLRYICRPRATPMAWWYKHMECMLGAGIGFHAAFFVFGTWRLLRIDLEGPWQLVPWLLPFAVGVPAMIVWVRYYERKFGEA